MYIDVVPNRNSPPAVLLRESVRDGRRTLKRTLANLSALPEEAVAALRVVLRGGRLVEAGEHFAVTRSLPCGHVRAVKLAMQRLGMAELVGSKPSPERQAVLAMIAQRIVRPGSKLESAALFGETTLAAEFGVAGVAVAKSCGVAAIAARSRAPAFMASTAGGPDGNSAHSIS